MGTALMLIVLAVVLGAAGLLFEAIQWAVIIAAVLFVAGIIAAFMGRGGATTTR